MDPGIAEGEALRKRGHLDEAALLFAGSGAIDAAEREFEALRDIDTSYFLVQQFLSRMRFSPNMHEGFNALKLPIVSVRDRLDALAIQHPALFVIRMIDRI